MKIVVLDGYALNPGDLSWQALGELGELTVYERTDLHNEAEIIERIADAELVFTNKTPLSRTTIEACPSIRFIGLLATGYNVVDYQFAGTRGIPVANVPGYGTAAVGQFAIALLLEICHRIGHHNDSVHRGDWAKASDFCYWDYPQIELAGKTMGIIGYGRIGQATGRIATALGMRVIAYSRTIHEEMKSDVSYVTLDELLKQSDVIALHCPLFPETEGIINQTTIAKMKDGVIILNNSRGQLIVEKDLAEALKSGKVLAAGIDVVTTEPISPDNPLYTAPNCIITPHIAWAARESRQRLMTTVVANAAAFLAGEPINTVNRYK